MNQGFHFVSVQALGSIFGESRFLLWSNEISIILILVLFVCCIGLPFDHNSWALQNHRQIENVAITHGFTYFFDTRSKHIELVLLTIKNLWAIWSHRQIETYWKYTRIFIFSWIRIGWILFTLENFWPRWNHWLVRKSSYFIRQMQKNDFLKSMQRVSFEPTCTCQKVVPPELLLSL